MLNLRVVQNTLFHEEKVSTYLFPFHLTLKWYPESFISKFQHLDPPQAPFILLWPPSEGRHFFVSKVCHVGYQTRCQSPTKRYLKTELENNVPVLRKVQKRCFFRTFFMMSWKYHIFGLFSALEHNFPILFSDIS